MLITELVRSLETLWSAPGSLCSGDLLGKVIPQEIQEVDPPVTKRGLAETIQSREQCEVRIFNTNSRHRLIPVNKWSINPAEGRIALGREIGRFSRTI